MSLAIHALFALILIHLPEPTHDPLRYLKHIETIPVLPPNALPAVTFSYAPEFDLPAQLGEDDIPEFALEQKVFAPEMPNIEKYVSPNEIVAKQDLASDDAQDEVVAKTPVNDAQPAPHVETPKPDVVEPQPSSETTSEAAKPQSASTSESNSGEAHKEGSANGVGAPGSVQGANLGGGGTSGSGAMLRAQDESALWKSYAAQLTRYFAQKRAYPAMAKKLGHSGTVWLDLELSRDGKVLSASVFKSSGSKILDQAALDLVRKASDIPAFPAMTSAQSKKVRVPFEYVLKSR